jgi:hypothetical protein
MDKHTAEPNSEATEKVSPASLNDQASYPGTEYGQGGNHPGQGDHSDERIVTRS